MNNHTYYENVLVCLDMFINKKVLTLSSYDTLAYHCPEMIGDFLLYHDISVSQLRDLLYAGKGISEMVSDFLNDDDDGY